MAYDPTLPVNNSPVASAELRSQFQGLKDEIDSKQSSATLADDVQPLTAGNCEGVGDLSLSLGDPPTAGEVQAIIDKINEMLSQLRRV